MKKTIQDCQNHQPKPAKSAGHFSEREKQQLQTTGVHAGLGHRLPPERLFPASRHLCSDPCACQLWMRTAMRCVTSVTLLTTSNFLQPPKTSHGALTHRSPKTSPGSSQPRTMEGKTQRLEHCERFRFAVLQNNSQYFPFFIPP